MIRIICDRCGKEIPAAGLTGYLAWNFRNGYRGELVQGNVLEDRDYCETCMGTIFDFISSETTGNPETEGTGADGGSDGNSCAGRKAGVCREKARRLRKNSIDMGKVMALRDAGWSYGKIADEMGMSKQSVCNAISRWKKAYGTGDDADAEPEDK